MTNIFDFIARADLQFDPTRMTYISNQKARALMAAWYVGEGFDAAFADGHFAPKDGDPRFPVDEFYLDGGEMLLRFPKRGWFLARD